MLTGRIRYKGRCIKKSGNAIESGKRAPSLMFEFALLLVFSEAVEDILESNLDLTKIG